MSHSHVDVFSPPVSPLDPGSSSLDGYPSPAESVALRTPFLLHASSQTEPIVELHSPPPRLFRYSLEKEIQQNHEHHSSFPAINGSPNYYSPVRVNEFVSTFSDSFSINTKHNGYRSVSPSLRLRHKNISKLNLDASLYSPHFPPGHRLNSYFARSYALEDELGSGGYGFVMTARHRNEGHEVAVKFIIKDKVPEHAWVEDNVFGKLPIEVILLNFIDHPNIIKCLDLFEDPLYFYLIQELHGSPWPKAKRHSKAIPGPGSTISPTTSTPTLSPSGSSSSLASSDRDESHSNFETPPRQPPSQLYDTSDLSNVFPPRSHSPPRPSFTRRPSHDLFECIEQSEHKRFSEDQARRVFSQVVDAVHYLHGQGVTHRDIKDENLVIDKSLNVKLIDFGSATVVDPNEPRPCYSLFFGTTAYASSEILLKKEYQAQPAEIWTLGVLLSYILTGTSPFPTVKDAINGRIVLPDALGARLSRAAISLMRRCLDPNPETRATIEEVKMHRWLVPDSP